MSWITDKDKPERRPIVVVEDRAHHLTKLVDTLTSSGSRSSDLRAKLKGSITLVFLAEASMDTASAVHHWRDKNDLDFMVWTLAGRASDSLKEEFPERYSVRETP